MLVLVLDGDMKDGEVSELEPEKLVMVITLGRGAETTVCVIVTVDATGVVTESEVSVVENDVIVVEVGIVAVVVSVSVVVSELDVGTIVGAPEDVVIGTDTLTEVGV